MNALPFFSKQAIWIVTLAGSLVAQPALAHWCSNIFNAPARLVVKPEKQTVSLKSGQPTTLRVYLKNNFPFTLDGLRMRGQASGYNITVSPYSMKVQPGQTAGYLFTITRSSGSGNVSVASLNLQVRFRIGGWRDSGNVVVDQSPGTSAFTSRINYSIANQGAAMAASSLSEQHPSTKLSTGSPYFGRTGIQQTIHWFGYRFCYSSGGYWRCGSSNCPSPCAEKNAWSATDQFGQNCMRAGLELVQWHARGKLGSNLSGARDAAVNAIQKGGSTEHRCLAAVVGGYLFQGTTGAAFTSALNSLPSACKKAGMRVFNGSNASSSCSGSNVDRAVCAAAEGLRGNDGPVKSILIPTSYDQNYSKQYHGYMLHMVTAHRMAKAGKVTYYPDAGKPVTGKQDGSTGPVCGDGQIDGSEKCDGSNLGGQSCGSLGFSGGTLSCNNTCQFNTSGCTKCGDGKISGSEKCDGAALGGQSCKSLGFSGGTLSCHGNCQFNTSSCYTNKCGDGKITAGEQCDGGALGGQSCKSLGYDGGTLSCLNTCKFNISGCHKCGDKKKNGGEQCDGGDLGGQSCKSKGYFKGTLSCKSNCTLNLAGCSNCGNIKLDSGEKCDGTQLAGKSCKALGFTAGSLSCKADCKAFNTDKCTTATCGNGKIDGNEKCDGKLLGGQTCKSQGFAGGTIKCKANCTLDTASCYKCGDGKLNAGEKCDGAALGGQTCKSLGFTDGALACMQNCTFDTSKCTSKTCGNGKLDAGEKCDGKILGGKTCKSLGFAGGTLKCKANCAHDTSSCSNPPKPDAGTPDTGTGPTPDSGQPDMGSSEPEPDEGCSVGGRSPSAPLLLLLLLGAVLFRIRRKGE